MDKRKPTINPRYKPKDRWDDWEAWARFAEGASSGLICVYRDGKTLKVEITDCTDDVEVVWNQQIDPESVKTVADDLKRVSDTLEFKRVFGTYRLDGPPAGYSFEDWAASVVGDAVAHLNNLAEGGR